eukprot:1250123-Amphidinium_carterae.2
MPPAGERDLKGSSPLLRGYISETTCSWLAFLQTGLALCKVYVCNGLPAPASLLSLICTANHL